MDFIRKSTYVRAVLPVLFGVAAMQISPLLFDAIRSGATPSWFEYGTAIGALTMAAVSLSMDDSLLRKRILTWVVRLFAVAVAFVLGFSGLSIFFLVVSLVYGSIEWPHRTAAAPEAAAY
ncbi:MAG: hypothetical protein U0893_18690 [Chloroflexota bacterium]